MTKIIDLDKDIKIEDQSVIGLGNFDGFHRGHRDIVKKAIDIAKEKNISSSVLLFKQHTNEVFPHFSRYYITSLEDKIELLEEMGIDIIYLISFTYEFAQLNRDQFVIDFLSNRLNAKTLVCGKDYTFGKPDQANVKHLIEYKDAGLIDLYVLNDIQYQGSKISSTKIRKNIEDGNISLANLQLARNYSVKGHVIHGFKIGSTELGYPTANIELSFRYIMPKEGVYLTWLYYEGKKYLSLTSIGTNPTVTDKNEVKFEVFILDFDKKIYGESVRVEFIEWIRQQIKFDTKNQLIDQMNKDFTYALDYKKSLQNK